MRVWEEYGIDAGLMRREELLRMVREKKQIEPVLVMEKQVSTQLGIQQVK